MKWTGRPPKFKNAEELEVKIAEYFNNCDETNEPYTVTGLALTIGITPKQLREYKNCVDDMNILKQLDDEEKRNLSNVVQKAYDFCAYYTEKKLVDPNCNKSPVGYIFALKNFGWKDKQEIEQTTKEIHVTLEDDEN